MTEIEPGVSVAGQLWPDDMAGLAFAGVTRVVNNRPDGEEPGQPSGAEIAAAARAAGLDYVAAPVAGGLTHEAIAEMGAALIEPGGHVIAFCKSGTRSAMLWAAARANQGADRWTIVEGAAAAGYDLRGMGMWSMLSALGAKD